MQTMFFNYISIKLRMSNYKITRKTPYIWKLTHTVLNSSEKYLDFENDKIPHIGT